MNVETNLKKTITNLLGVGLWPNMPQKNDGHNMDPTRSEPTPMTEAAALSKAACISKSIY